MNSSALMPDYLRSCGTLQRALSFVDNQGPHEKLGQQAKELDTISNATTIVSLGSTHEPVCLHGQLAYIGLYRGYIWGNMCIDVRS